MRLLLDTHVYLWCVNNDPRLSSYARRLIQSAQDIYVSSASVWEMAIKINLGKLCGDLDELIKAINESNFTELPIIAQHAACLQKLPTIHRDPFDRMLICQSICEPLRLLTADQILAQYPAQVEVI